MDSAKRSHAVVIGGSIAGLNRRFDRAQWKALRSAWGISYKLEAGE